MEAHAPAAGFQADACLYKRSFRKTIRKWPLFAVRLESVEAGHRKGGNDHESIIEIKLS